MRRERLECWCRLRRRSLTRLVLDASRGLVDPDILDILLAFNNTPCIATISSCSGRIALIAAPTPGDKKRGGIVAKWHRRVSVRELNEALSIADRSGYVWLSVQPIVLALYVYGAANAFRVAEVLVKAGLKYTGVRVVSSCPNTYYVLSMGVERLDIPLFFHGYEIIPSSNIKAVLDMANSLLTLTKSKLEIVRRAAVSLHSTLECDEATLCGFMKNIDLADERRGLTLC